MAYLNDEVFDSGLDNLTANLDQIDLCSQEPSTYTEATSTYTLGNGSCTTGAAEAGDVSGRKVAVGAVSGGSVTGTGTATHVGGSDGTSVLWAATALSASQAVTSGNTFDLAAWDIEINDPS